MAERIALVAGSSFTKLEELKPTDTLQGVVNLSSIPSNGVVVRNNTGTIVYPELVSNTILGNLGTGIGATTLADLKTALSVPVTAIAAVGTTSITAVPNTLHPIDVRTGTCLVSPPVLPTANTTFAVVDAYKNSEQYPITVNFTDAGQKFYGQDASDVIAEDGKRVLYRFINGTIGWIAEK